MIESGWILISIWLLYVFAKLNTLSNSHQCSLKKYIYFHIVYIISFADIWSFRKLSVFWQLQIHFYFFILNIFRLDILLIFVLLPLYYVSWIMMYDILHLILVLFFFYFFYTAPMLLYKVMLLFGFINLLWRSTQKLKKSGDA